MTTAAGDDDVSDVSAFKVRWWRDRYFTGERAHFWPEELEDCPTWHVNPAYQLATDGPHRHVRTAAAAYVWGVGKSAYQIGWLARAFTTDPAAVERKLGGAAEVLAEEGPVAAYRSMLLPGAPNNIKFMGPAYFTKFLFFTGYRTAVPGSLAPLILDKRVATALRAWQIRPGWPNSGWSGSQYESYLDYGARQPDGPEAVEQELFRGGDRKGVTRPRPSEWSGA